VGYELGAPPNVAIAISTSTIRRGETSGDHRLDAAASRLADGLTRRSEAEIRDGDQQIEASCIRLGIWTNHHG
jgi:hypothetical protein